MKYFIGFILGVMWGHCMCACGGEVIYKPPNDPVVQDEVIPGDSGVKPDVKTDEDSGMNTHLFSDCELPKFQYCAVCYGGGDCWTFVYFKCELIGAVPQQEGTPSPIPLDYPYEGDGRSYCQ